MAASSDCELLKSNRTGTEQLGEGHGVLPGWKIDFVNSRREMTAFQTESEPILVWQGNGETVWLEPWGQDTIRVRATMAPAPQDLPGALVAPPQATAEIVIQESRATITNGKLTGEGSTEGHFRFLVLTRFGGG